MVQALCSQKSTMKYELMVWVSCVYKSLHLKNWLDNLQMLPDVHSSREELLLE